MSVKVLSCKCGDCLHWEIFRKPHSWSNLSDHLKTETFMVCKTCGDEHHIEIKFPDHEKLDWVDHETS